MASTTTLMLSLTIVLASMLCAYVADPLFLPPISPGYFGGISSLPMTYGGFPGFGVPMHSPIFFNLDDVDYIMRGAGYGNMRPSRPASRQSSSIVIDHGRMDRAIIDTGIPGVTYVKPRRTSSRSSSSTSNRRRRTRTSDLSSQLGIFP